MCTVVEFAVSCHYCLQTLYLGHILPPPLLDVYRFKTLRKYIKV